MIRLRQGNAYCANEARRFDRDRYLCALLAPAARRPALFALIAFNLELARTREAVSEALLGRVRLQWWRDAVAGMFAGVPRPEPHPVLGPLAAAVAEHGLSRGHFDRLIDARERDLDDAPPADLDALITYAEGSASSLVLLALEALGAAHPAALEAGRRVGIAWALTGLARAVPFHARQGRLYLPVRLTAEAGLNTRHVLDLRPSPEACRVIERLAGAAREHLRAARARRREIPRTALPALLPATLADAYLRRIERAAYDVIGAEAAINAPAPAWRPILNGLVHRF